MPDMGNIRIKDENMNKIETPTLDIMIEIQEQSQLCGEFLDWLLRKYTMFDRKQKRESPFANVMGNGDYINKEKLLAEFFDIDLVEAAKEYLQILPHQYYEENNLHGLLIEQIKDYDTCLEELERFLPYIDNWATCDLLALHMMKKHRDIFIREIYRWMESDKPYIIRFGIGMLMRHYLDEGFKPEYPEKVVAIRSEEYYVNMMRAWYFATALAKQYDKILPFIEKQKLDVWTHNKTIQKAIESYRITPEQKEYLRGLKIKK